MILKGFFFKDNMCYDVIHDIRTVCFTKPHNSHMNFGMASVLLIQIDISLGL